MSSPLFWSAPASLLALGVYLFATAPVALPDTANGAPVDTAAQIPIEKLFELIAAENDAVRLMYTKEIVGAGKKVGLKFSEQWKERAVQAGPLPALFLRESAASLQRSPVPLGLYLGSDFPIQPSNTFEGKAAEYFVEVKRTREPRYFYAEDLGRHTAMFPDFAVADACVTCHNEYKESPKTDWVLNDVMGATTWTYPKATVSLKEALEVLGAARHAFAVAYGQYLKEIESFDAPPEIGERWPRDGYYVPSAAAFVAEAEARASAGTVRRLLSIQAAIAGPAVPMKRP